LAQDNPIRASEVVTLSVLIHDRDRTFAAKADGVLESEGARVIVTPLMAPKANAHAERWVGRCRREFHHSARGADQAEHSARRATERLPPRAACCVTSFPNPTGGVGSARREFLDWMLIVSQRHLGGVLSEYCAHYNHERPHRNCGLRPPASRGEPIRRPGATIRGRARLIGQLDEYSRAPQAA